MTTMTIHTKSRSSKSHETMKIVDIKMGMFKKFNQDINPLWEKKAQQLDNKKVEGNKKCQASYMPYG